MQTIFRLYPETLILPPLVAIILLNQNYLHNKPFGIVVALLYIGILLYLFILSFKNQISILNSLALSLLLLLCLTAGFGGIGYFLWRFDTLLFLVLLLIPICFLFFLSSLIKQYPKIKHQRPFYKPNKRYITLLGVFILLILFNFFFLFKAQTTDATSNLWAIIDRRIFITFFLASFILIYTSIIYRKQPLILIMQILYIFFICTVVIIVFPLGFGFDPFIHQSAQKYILQNEFIYPKTPYYLGQYSLVLFFSKLFFIPVVWVDKLLLPLIASFLLPVLSWMAFEKKRYGFLGLGIMLAIPYSIFINTTPQSLANILVLFLVLLLISPVKKALSKKTFFLITCTIALGAAVIHPIAGIPAIIFLIIFLARRSLHPLVLIFLSLLLPGILLSQGSLRFLPLGKFLLPIISNKFIFWENGIHLYTANIAFIIIFIVIASFFTPSPALSRIRPRALSAFSILFVSSLLTLLFIDFRSLVSYERSSFGLRMLEISFYPLIPVFVGTILIFFKKLSRTRTAVPFMLLISFFLTGAFYSSFPHSDRFSTSKLHTLSQADIKAVTFVEEHANGAPYVVLANQMTSAGALWKFGFSRYMNTAYGQLYFYPIPTSSPLYPLYLNMAEGTPSQEIIHNVRNLMGVEKIYMILDSYWTNFKSQTKKIAPLAKEINEIDNGKAVVFVF